MEWMLLPLKRYADFQGRSRRMEYWMFYLGYVIVTIILLSLVFATIDFRGSAPGAMTFLMFGLLGVVALGLILPTLAVTVRRFHDQNLTGWLMLLGLIPYLGGIVLLVFMCLPGTKGANKFGPDPLDPHGTNVAEVFL